MTIQKISGGKALIVCLATAVLLSACASSNKAGGASATPRSDAEEGGIQTQAIRTAPAARPAVNHSRPLSQLNTPDAIASREAAARRARAAAPPAPAKVVEKSSVPGFAAFIAAAAANPAPQIQPSAAGTLQKGSKVHVRSGASLHARPSADSETTAIAQNAELELGQQLSNAGGSWWYIAAGNDSGWLLQSDITR